MLFRFPQADLAQGKLRPALLLGRLPGEFEDWLICMISSRLTRYIEGFDEIVKPGDDDFGKSGLKIASVIRVGRLAVIDGESLLGAIGEIDLVRLRRLKHHVVDWLTESTT